MNFNIKTLYEDVRTPIRAKEGDAGLDVFARENKVLEPGERYLFLLGFQAEFPTGYVCFVRPRSGLALKSGLDILAGTIDSGYRGEYGVLAINLSEEPIVIYKNDKIAQLVLIPCSMAEVVVVTDLQESERGEKGYGSTGI